MRQKGGPVGVYEAEGADGGAVSKRKPRAILAPSTMLPLM